MVRYITMGEGTKTRWRMAISASTKSSMCLDERIKFKCEGGGKPVKVSLFNEAMALHEAGVDGVVHGWCFYHKVSSMAG